jgi:signal transduction histidine kinase
VSDTFLLRGHLELLDEDPEDRQQTLTLVLDKLDRMSRIVDDLLLLAKVEQPDFLRGEQLDLGDLTRGWHARARTLADREWRLEHVAEAQVVADGQRLTQAVMNLAHNAAQHTEAGSVIDLGSSVSDGRARLWVRDRGPGVRPEDRGRIPALRPGRRLPAALRGRRPRVGHRVRHRHRPRGDG